MRCACKKRACERRNRICPVENSYQPSLSTSLASLNYNLHTSTFAIPTALLPHWVSHRPRPTWGAASSPVNSDRVVQTTRASYQHRCLHWLCTSDKTAFPISASALQLDWARPRKLYTLRYVLKTDYRLGVNLTALHCLLPSTSTSSEPFALPHVPELLLHRHSLLFLQYFRYRS